MSGSVRAAMAVDGDTTQSKWYLCIQTSMGQQFSWWEVDLGKNYFIHEVRIYFRTDWKWRRNGVLVYTSESPRQINKGQQCGEQIKGYKNGFNIADIVKRTCDSVGRYVTLYEDTLNKDTCHPCDGGRGMDFCEIEVYACELNVKYGSNCDKKCNDRHCAVTSSSCNVKTGDCDSGGCKPGWTGNDCTTDVDECLKSDACDPNANCSNTIGSFICTCLSGYSGNGHKCTACEAGVKYGPNCSKLCSNRKCKSTKSSCDKATGKCQEGCQKGWKDDDCTRDVDECLVKDSCDKNAVCNNTPGSFTCTCKIGFTGDGKTCTDVNECLKSDTCDPNANCTNTNGSYTCTCLSGYSGDGHSCTDVDECTMKKSCDSNANCTNTEGSYVCICQHGFTGDGKTCEECVLNVSYGYNCSNLCENRKCSNSSTCNRKTGSCLGGCMAGWIGVDCIHDVDECKNVSICDVNADCKNTEGSYTCTCQSGFSGSGESCSDIDECIQQNNCHSKAMCNNTVGSYLCSCPSGYFGDGINCTQNAASTGSSQTAAIAGSTVAIILIICVIVIVVVIVMRRRRMTKRDTETFLDMDTLNSHTSSPRSKNVNKADNIYENVGNQQQHSSNRSEISKQEKANVKSAGKTESNTAEEEVDEEEKCEDTADSVYCNVTEFSLPDGGVPVSELSVILNKIRNQTGGFATEFQKLQKDFVFSYNESQITENRSKNRFASYYPYDQNRVCLTLLPGVPNSDYINASYIDAFNEKDYFIAAQAPNKKTLQDFWRMIWEKECGHIIMLTNLIEATKSKCEPYWSDTDVMTVGALTVTVTEKDERSDFVFRKFSVTHKKSGKTKIFQQFHFTAWPDHGIPNIQDFIQFVWRVRKTKPILSGPVLVHCSAGVGRTGTYIALDVLVDEMEATGRVDIKKVMKQMRDQRKGLVQTKEQYEMIFIALLNMAEFGNTSVDAPDFLKNYTKQKGSMKMGNKTVNKLALEIVKLNGTSYTASPDKYRVWVSGCSDIFATLPPSKLRNQGYLLTPEPNGSEESFWKLVSENDSYTIITLSSKTGMKLFPKTSQNITFGKTTVTALQQTSIIHEITETTLQVENKGDPIKREIQHYTISGWSPTTDSATLISCLSTITEQIHKQERKLRSHPVTITYRDSEAKNAIILCIANEIMTGIKVDKEVEIFNNIRRFQAVLPNIQFTKEDFTFFCNMVLFNLESSSVYANC